MVSLNFKYLKCIESDIFSDPLRNYLLSLSNEAMIQEKQPTILGKFWPLYELWYRILQSRVRTAGISDSTPQIHTASFWFHDNYPRLWTAQRKRGSKFSSVVILMLTPSETSRARQVMNHLQIHRHWWCD